MTSTEIRQTLATAAWILALAALAEPGTVVAQPEANDELVQAIESIEADTPKGPQSAELIDPLKTLALRYQEDESHTLARAAIDRALDIVRVNYGLHSLEQAPLIRQAIDNEEARDNHAAVWELEHELLDLVERHPDDLRTVPILREIANWRMDVIDRYVAGDYPPEIPLGCYYRSKTAIHGSCTSGSKSIAVREILLDAWQYYEDAIAVILRNDLYASEELRELELTLIRGNYRYGDVLLSAVPRYYRGTFPPSRYERGKERLHRLAEHSIANSDPLGEIDALVQLADWELEYSNNSLALEGYAQAYERLLREEAPQEFIERLFSPDMPIVLPAFMPNPLVSEETPESTGYIDVGFEITRYGRSRQIDILDTTTNASKDARHRLVDLISDSRFRLRMRDGQFDDNWPVVLRYYLEE